MPLQVSGGTSYQWFLGGNPISGATGESPRPRPKAMACAGREKTNRTDGRPSAGTGLLRASAKMIESSLSRRQDTPIRAVHLHARLRAARHARADHQCCDARQSLHAFAPFFDCAARGPPMTLRSRNAWICAFV